MTPSITDIYEEIKKRVPTLKVSLSKNMAHVTIKNIIVFKTEGNLSLDNLTVYLSGLLIGLRIKE